MYICIKWKNNQITSEDTPNFLKVNTYILMIIRYGKYIYVYKYIYVHMYKCIHMYKMEKQSNYI
jgi:hypothetical protein